MKVLNLMVNKKCFSAKFKLKLTFILEQLNERAFVLIVKFCLGEK